MNVDLLSLWSPILLSTVGVFLAGNLVWIVLRYHKSDWKELPDEDAVREVLRGTKPGSYSVPFCAEFRQRDNPAWQAKYEEGPVLIFNVFPRGPVSSLKPLVQWMSYCLVISTLVAYIAGTALSAGAPFMKVFQVTATVAVLAYSGSSALGSIWYGQPWTRTFKDVVDGIIYGHLTAVIFAWLWP
jgi:hypothetical protein